MEQLIAAFEALWVKICLLYTSFQLRFIHHEPIVHQFINDFYIAVFIFKFLEKSKLIFVIASDNHLIKQRKKGVLLDAGIEQIPVRPQYI